MRLSALFRVIVLCLMSASFPCLVSSQNIVGNIVGEVTVERMGFPPKPILVSLKSRGAPINSLYTDGQGRFGFSYLPAGTYEIAVQDDDYAPVSVRVDLNPLFSQTANANITLSPKKLAKTDQSAERVRGSNPNVIDPSEYLRKFPKKAVKEYDKGLEASRSSNTDSAIKHFEKSIELAPDFYPAHNELGRVYMASADFTAAQHEFEEAIRLNQSDAEGHLNLANVFLLTKHYDDAMKNVEEGLRRDPTSAVGQFVLGSIYERTGRFQDAERALHQALQIDPRMSRVHLELVNLYLMQQKNSQATGELKAFLKDFPDDPLAPKAREVLARLDHVTTRSNAATSK
ncbi:MAG TPA: tetratricopeptide repeat protein [Terriglobales bacterium]|nr:tetratricopeptide repeat protein [Terriglobales bacterium]